MIAATALGGGARWTTPRETYTVVGGSVGAVRVAAGRVEVEARVYDTGVFEVALTGAASCERDVLEQRRVRGTSRRELTNAGWAAIGWGLFAPVAGFGIDAIRTSGDDEASGGALPWVGAGIGAVLIGSALAARFARTRRVITREKQVVLETEPVACGPDQGGTLPDSMSARTPWGALMSAPLDAHGRARFEVDWTATGVDPLADDAATRMTAAWILRDGDGEQLATWTPDARDVETMLAVIGERTDTQVQVVTGGLAPSLGVASLGVVGEARARSGEEVELALTVENRGKGAAYRVVVTTHSGLPALRALRFSFGRIDPGARKTKTVRVRLPAQSRDSREAVVLRFAEATGRAPAEQSAPLGVARARAPSLTLACALDRPVIDPGTAGTVQCEVRNDGEAAARDVAIAVTLNGAAVGSSAPVAIAVGDTATLRVDVPVPAAAQLDDVVAIRITATAANARGATWDTTARAGKPPICASKISQREYESRRARLKKALDAGALTRAEYDEAHAQLVRCLTAE